MVPPRNEGFTLIEVAVVLLILAVALAVSVPAVPLPRAVEDRAAAALGRKLGVARDAAANSGGETSLRIELPTGRYLLTSRGDAERADSTLAEGVIPGWAGSELAHRGSDSVLLVRFDPLGHSNGGALRWRARNGGERALRVNPWTGEVRIGAR